MRIDLLVIVALMFPGKVIDVILVVICFHLL